MLTKVFMVYFLRYFLTVLCFWDYVKKYKNQDLFYLFNCGAVCNK